jgi:hypothetical protein
MALYTDRNYIIADDEYRGRVQNARVTVRGNG